MPTREVVWSNPALDQSWTMVPNAVLDDASLSIQARLLYSALARYAWDKPEAWPGQVRLAESLGASERSVRRWLKELEKSGLVRVEQRGMMKTNVYHLNAWRNQWPDTSVLNDRTPVSAEVKQGEVDEEEVLAQQSRAAFARHLFAQWKLATGHLDAKLGKRRFEAVMEALDRGENAEQLELAVWGISESDWHAERGIDEFQVAIKEGSVERFALLGSARKHEAEYEANRAQASLVFAVEAQAHAVEHEGYVRHPDGYLVHPISMTPGERQRYEDSLTPKEDSNVQDHPDGAAPGSVRP